MPQSISEFVKEERATVFEHLRVQSRAMPALRSVVALITFEKECDATGQLPPACPLHKKTFSLEDGSCLTGENYSFVSHQKICQKMAPGGLPVPTV